MCVLLESVRRQQAYTLTRVFEARVYMCADAMQGCVGAVRMRVFITMNAAMQCNCFFRFFRTDESLWRRSSPAAAPSSGSRSLLGRGVRGARMRRRHQAAACCCIGECGNVSANVGHVVQADVDCRRRLSAFSWQHVVVVGASHERVGRRNDVDIDAIDISGRHFGGGGTSCALLSCGGGAVASSSVIGCLSRSDVGCGGGASSSSSLGGAGRLWRRRFGAG